MKDGDILALFLAGDEQAIAECERKYGAVCRRIAGNILSSPEDAEECVSDTWMRAWRSIPADPPRKLGAYLTAIVRNLALDRLRAERSGKRGGGECDRCLDELAETLPAKDVSPEAEVLLRDLMTRFVLSLKPEEREIFLFRYRNVETVAEIARIVGKKPETIKSVLFRCRKKLRDYLKKEGIDV